MEEKVALSESRLEELRKEKSVTFFSSGSTLLDLSLGGGWALGRVFNIVGDRSSGKTLLAIEAFANFAKTFPNGRMRYAEAEAAFDDSFAEVLGFPPSVERPEQMLHTVEEFSKDLFKFANQGGPSLYILDSLDALSDDAEVERFTARMEGKEEKGSMGAQKAKEMSEMFRSITAEMAAQDCTLGIVSQIRDRIGISFGETKTRSGGRALDFYASQVLWLVETGKNKKTVRGVERVIGVNINSKVKKCKVGLPFREANYAILFNYGIDNHMSMIEWLSSNKFYETATATAYKKQLAAAREAQDRKALNDLEAILIEDTTRSWKEIDDKLITKLRKYE